MPSFYIDGMDIRRAALKSMPGKAVKEQKKVLISGMGCFLAPLFSSVCWFYAPVAYLGGAVLARETNISMTFN